MASSNWVGPVVTSPLKHISHIFVCVSHNSVFKCRVVIHVIDEGGYRSVLLRSGYAWDAVWFTLVTAAAAATAAVTSGGVGGASQSALVPQPLAIQLQEPLDLGSGGEDAAVVSNPRLVRSFSYRSNQACATLSSVHGNPSDWYSVNLAYMSFNSGDT